MFTATKDENLSNMNANAKNLKDNAETAMNAGKDDLRKAANKAGRRVRGFFSNAGDELSGAADTVTSQIRNKPIQSSLIALGAGLVIGALLRR